ncbi:MAG: histone deacetylase [Rhodothermales bacterium]
MGKFPALHRLLLREGYIRHSDVLVPREADWSDLLLVHSNDYLHHLAHGSLGRKQVRKMGLPWSPSLVRRSRLAVQGTINAALAALIDGIAANLAGGTHHAFPAYGSGFCVLNDVAVATRVLLRSHWIRRAFILDLDVHQGDGTAAIFRDDERVYTLSMHGAKNFPFLKERSSLDLALQDDASNAEYLALLSRHLSPALDSFQPDIVFYLAGIDVVAGDRFGRIRLTREGLEERERVVLETCHRKNIPIVLLLSGGYAETPEHTADLHAVAHRVARAYYS